jgi:NOL1/NOP2/fmu family ribosome biogenesis protein
MAQELTILNSKETKKVHATLLEQYGYEGRIDLVLLLSEKKERLHLFTKDLALLDLEGLRIDSMGVYFGTYVDGKLRLTIEGSQLIGPACTRNVVALAKAQMQRWLSGESLPLEGIEGGDALERGAFVLLRCGGDFLGCGKVGATQVHNYIPKTRYIHATYDEHESE